MKEPDSPVKKAKRVGGKSRKMSSLNSQTTNKKVEKGVKDKDDGDKRKTKDRNHNEKPKLPLD
jgi:hypothetical protein